MSVVISCDTEIQANSWKAYFSHIGAMSEVIKIMGRYIVIRIT